MVHILIITFIKLCYYAKLMSIAFTFKRKQGIIPFSTVEEDNNGEVHWNEKDLAV